MNNYLVKRCPGCGDQIPKSFEECIYCGTDLRAVEPSEHEPLDMTPTKVKTKKRYSIPRIKKWDGYEEVVMDATPEDDLGDSIRFGGNSRTSEKTQDVGDKV